jgi:tetratricopeptide (TPR) repeat protein
MKVNLNQILKEFDSGKKESAYFKLKKYVNKNNTNIQARYNLAVMEQQLGYFNLAIKNFKYIILIDSKHINSITNLYVIYIEKKNYQEALKLIDKALIIQDNKQSLLRDKSLLLYYLKKPDEAIMFAKKALELNSQDLITLNNIGLILMSLKKYDEAKKILIKGLTLDSSNIYLVNSMGRCYGYLNDSLKAINFFKKAINLQPEAHQPINNLAGYFVDSGKYEKGLKYYKKALEKDPQNIIIIANMAKTYLHLNEDVLAEEYCQKCLNLDPSNNMIKKTYALFLLKKQKYEKAWHYFDGRLNLDEFTEKNSYVSITKKYLWKGEKIRHDDKILIIREQGVGDEILYGTMYTDLINKFENVTIESDKRLIPLFENSFSLTKNQKFVPLGAYSKNEEKLKSINAVMYAGSLGQLFRNDLKDFNKKPYLKIIKEDNDQIIESLSKMKSKYKIGISWKSFQNNYGSSKSISLETLKPILNRSEINFINLQYGNVANEIKKFVNQHSISITTLQNIDLFNDLSKICALLKNLDIFITVSNSTAHLAGALGVKTWLIKPKNHATFHYWNQPKNTTPWYDSITILSANSNANLIKRINMNIDNLIS